MVEVIMNAKRIGRKLEGLRGDRTQAEVANAIGTSVTAITNYESGTRIPRDEIKIRLAKYFNTTVDSLFFDVDVTDSDKSAQRPR